jgi:hypothetical protein
MNDYVLNKKAEPASNDKFLTGLVFGFDVGTGSIGYAVRKGSVFKDVGVLICPEDTSKLDKRRGSRSQRRRLRNRNRVRDWLADQLEEKLGLPSPWMKTADGQIVLKPGLDYARISNPVLLRCEALQGRIEKPEELHAAITHLWKRRGKTEVPWKQGEAKQETAEQKEEKKIIAKKLNALAKEMAAGDGTKNPDGSPKAFEHPCQLLLHRQKLGIKQRDEVWPRDEFQKPFDFNLKTEFLAIIIMAAGLKNENGGQRHSFPRAPGIGQQFTSLFTDLMIQRHRFQKRNERVPIILPALFLARVFQRLPGDVFRDRGITNKNFMAGGHNPFAEIKIPAFAFHQQGSIQQDSHFARSIAARLAEISWAVSAPKGERER